MTRRKTTEKHNTMMKYGDTVFDYHLLHLQHAFVRQTECTIATIILVANFAFLFNSTTMSRSLD